MEVRSGTDRCTGAKAGSKSTILLISIKHTCRIKKSSTLIKKIHILCFELLFFFCKIQLKFQLCFLANVRFTNGQIQ